jgi:hypothetical protein
MLLMVCLFFTFRAVVIIGGWWKEPVLRTFRSYGSEVRYYPVAHFLAWLCASLLMLMIILYPRRTPSLVLFGGLMLLFAILWAHNYPEHVKALFDRLPIYPLWHRRLRDYTSRYERRRIGYLWLRLPIHLRALLNRHDEIFLQWSDFVVMGSVMEEDISRERFEASYLEQQLYERHQN